MSDMSGNKISFSYEENMDSIKIAKLEKENEELKYELKYAIEIIEKNRNNRMEGISYNE